MAFAGAAALATGLAFFAPNAVAAGTTRLVATDGTDTGTCVSDPCQTLQYAVDHADPGDTVSVGAGTYAQSVEITTSLTLIGAGSSGSGRTTLSGDSETAAETIFVTGGANVTIKDLDVSGNGEESGIVINDATATVEDSVVSDNETFGVWVQQSGSALVTSSSVSNNADDGLLLEGVEEVKTDVAQVEGDPSATVTNSDLSHNGGSGIAVLAGGASADHSTINANASSGVVVDDGTGLDITNSTLDSNVFFGAVAEGNAQLSLTKSTVSNSQPGQPVRVADVVGTEFGGGVAVFDGATADIDTSTVYGNTGQGVLNDFGSVTIENSTIAGTLQPAGEDSESGGIELFPYGGIAVVGRVTPTIREAVAALPANRGRAAAAEQAVTAPSTTVTGTIVADNTTLDDCATTNDAVITDGGYNLDSDGSCEWSAPGSISNGDPKLGPLTDNGGPTQTLLPAKGSDAIDAIPTGKANCSADATDQRAVSRPQGTNCDIGAVEAAQPPIVISPGSLPDGTVGTPYNAQLSATGGLGAPYEFSLVSGDSLPPGLTLTSGGTISGTPTTPGTFPFTVSVDDPTLKDYTIVITAPASSSVPPSTPPASSTTPVPSSSLPSSASPTATTLPVANTGAPVGQMTTLGTLAFLLGALLLIGTVYSGRRYRRTH